MLSFGIAGRSVVVVMEVPSSSRPHERRGAGHRPPMLPPRSALSPNPMASVAPMQIGRMLYGAEAVNQVAQLEGRNPTPPPRKLTTLAPLRPGPIDAEIGTSDHDGPESAM
jgi:hypothetical protein